LTQSFDPRVLIPITSRLRSSRTRRLPRILSQFVAMAKAIVLSLITICASAEWSGELADILMERALQGCVDPAELDDVAVGKGGVAKGGVAKGGGGGGLSSAQGGKVFSKDVMSVSAGSAPYNPYPGFKPGSVINSGAGFSQQVKDPKEVGNYKASLRGNIFGREKLAKEGYKVGVSTNKNRPRRWGQTETKDGLLPCQQPPKKWGE